MRSDDLGALDGAPHDPLAEGIAAIDQHIASLPHSSRLLAAEHAALVEQGMSGFDAATLVGARWRMT